MRWFLRVVQEKPPTLPITGTCTAGTTTVTTAVTEQLLHHSPSQCSRSSSGGSR